MAYEEWLIEHSVEIASLVVAIAGFVYVGKQLSIINNQKQSLQIINSKNNSITQIANLNSEDASKFEKALKNKKEVFLSSDTTKKSLSFEKKLKKGHAPHLNQYADAKKEYLEEKQLIDKIENHLDENKSVSTAATMCLRLAQRLDMKEEINWLSKEINGFENKNEKILEFKNLEGHEFKPYRKVEAKILMQPRDKLVPHEFTLRIFLGNALEKIEYAVNNNPPTGLFLMEAPPFQQMIDDLHIQLGEKIPYLIDLSSFRNILNGVKNELNIFLEKARKEIDSTTDNKN